MWIQFGGNPLSLFDQIILKLYTFIIFFICVVLIIVGLGLFQDEVYSFIELLFNSIEAKILFIGIVLILVVISLRFLFYGSKQSGEVLTINTRNDLGEMRTSITTFETIASKTVQKVVGVRDSQVRFKGSEVDGHQFFIKVVIDGDVPIPQITEQIQRDVKSKVEEITGVQIQQVSVLITDVVSTQTQKARRVE